MSPRSTATVATVAAAVVALSGCTPTLTPSPATATPAPSSFVPAPTSDPSPTATPSPTPELIPGTNLTAGPEPDTVIGPTGAVLRFVPADPSWTPKCRPITDAERADLERHVGGQGGSLRGVNYSKGAPQAVDLPEAGWSVIAFWDRWEGGESFDAGAVRGGGSTSGVGTAWPGTHTWGGAAFADGPEALRAARECAFS